MYYWHKIVILFTLNKCCSGHVLHRNYIERRLTCANFLELLRSSMLRHCCEKNWTIAVNEGGATLSEGSLTTWWGWTMTNHMRDGVSLGLRPQSVKSPFFERGELHREQAQRRQRARAGASQLAQCSCTVLLCVSLLFFTRSHLSLLHSVAEYVQEDQTSAHDSWNLRTWHKIIYAWRCVIALVTYDTNIMSYFIALAWLVRAASPILPNIKALFAKFMSRTLVILWFGF